MLADGNRVVSQLQITGTHRGEWMGVAPTDRSIDVPLFVVHRIENQKIVEDWVLVGTLTFFQQLGIVRPTNELFGNKQSSE
jgi:predicted ester cyclase